MLFPFKTYCFALMMVPFISWYLISIYMLNSRYRLFQKIGDYMINARDNKYFDQAVEKLYSSRAPISSAVVLVTTLNHQAISKVASIPNMLNEDQKKISSGYCKKMTQNRSYTTQLANILLLYYSLSEPGDLTRQDCEFIAQKIYEFCKFVDLEIYPCVRRDFRRRLIHWPDSAYDGLCGIVLDYCIIPPNDYRKKSE